MADNLTEVPKSIEKMSLEEAQEVLATVVGIDEAGFERPADLEKVPKYNPRSFSQAIGVVADKLFPWWDGRQGGLMKEWGDQLVLLRRTKDFGNPKLETLILTLAEQNTHKMPSRSIIDTTVRLDETGVLIEKSSFQDQRSTVPVRLTSKEEFREVWRGVRWLAYNLANWKGEFRLPEQLRGEVA